MSDSYRPLRQLGVEDVVTIRPGDLIVAYGDGISEARNSAGEMFDEVAGSGTIPQGDDQASQHSGNLRHSVTSKDFGVAIPGDQEGLRFLGRTIGRGCGRLGTRLGRDRRGTRRLLAAQALPEAHAPIPFEPLRMPFTWIDCLQSSATYPARSRYWEDPRHNLDNHPEISSPRRPPSHNLEPRQPSHHRIVRDALRVLLHVLV